MARYGYVRTKLDIKLLILYFLSKLPKPADFDDLTALSVIDGAIDFFDFCQCLVELESTEHIEKSPDGMYSVTSKGINNCRVCESNIVWSVRKKADALISGICSKLSRSAMITADISERESGDYNVHLELKDTTDSILSIDIMASSENQAGVLQRNFKNNAEKIYNAVLKSLLDDYGNPDSEWSTW